VKKTPLYTTYLAFLRKANYNPLNVFPNDLRETILYYVMRNRGNNEVAPSGLLLEWVSLQKEKWGKQWMKISWIKYEKEYLDQLQRFQPAHEWMRKIAEEAKTSNVILICHEKDFRYCHRKLLAQEIARRFSVEYKGELTLKDVIKNG